MSRNHHHHRHHHRHHHHIITEQLIRARVCSEEERNMDDKLMCDEVHLRTLSQSPVALQRQQQRRLSNHCTRSTATKTLTPILRRRCSGGNAVSNSNECEQPRPPLAQHEILDDDEPKCQRVRVDKPTNMSLNLDVTDNGDSGVGGDDETEADADADADADCGLTNPAAQIADDNDEAVKADVSDEDVIDSSILRVKQFPDMSKIPRLPGDGAQMDDQQPATNTTAIASNLRRPAAVAGRGVGGGGGGGGGGGKNTPWRVQSVRIVEQRMKLGPKRRTESCSIFGNTSNYDCEADACSPTAQPRPLTNQTYSAFKSANVVKGILCPSLTNSFKQHSLERSYLLYTHRQRQKSLIIVNLVDFMLKVTLATIWFVKEGNVEGKAGNGTYNALTNSDSEDVKLSTAITWSVCCIVANVSICCLGFWRCFANNYLHWAAVCTWVLMNIQ
ncbi:PREDICTED: uncharacterized protein LOC108371962, partial [Rhagoletis zephyria]|uniref:uncharacterized protein LOC108371962 n=1 Tax=Rhagoletis zephyria TaxID=28612 RepID=UPI00081194EF